MDKQYQFDYVVFIGRFQPPHIGHIDVVNTALKYGRKVIIVVGSADQPRSPKNPFTVIERIAMLSKVLGVNNERIMITHARDYPNNDDKWTGGIQQAVEDEILRGGWTDYPAKVAIIGPHKDSSTFYLDLFPQWKAIDHTINERINATDIRTLYFEGANMKYFQGLVPEYVFEFLSEFRNKEEYRRLCTEYNYIKAYKKSWEAAPYTPSFITGDAVVVQSGHILLVKRGSAPGEGLLALPGGFINTKERILDGVMRELTEETKIKVPEKVLRGSVVASAVFDHPERSQRGRTVTHAYHIALPPGPLPKVKGSDDAVDAKWYPVERVIKNWNKLFEDHGDIISHFNIGV